MDDGSEEMMAGEAQRVLELLKAQKAFLGNSGHAGSDEEDEPILRIDAAGAGMTPGELRDALSKLAAAGIVEMVGVAGAAEGGVHADPAGGERAPGLCRLEEAGGVHLIRLAGHSA